MYIHFHSLSMAVAFPILVHSTVSSCMHACMYVCMYIHVCTLKGIITWFNLLLTLGGLTLRQVGVFDGESWPIEGVATYEYSGCCPEQFRFQCLTDNDISDGIEFSWKKGSVSVEQNGVEGGVQFSLLDPTSNDAGVYTCSLLNNSVTIESISINITAGMYSLAVTYKLYHIYAWFYIVSHQSLTRSPCSRHAFISVCVAR